MRNFLKGLRDEPLLDLSVHVRGRDRGGRGGSGNGVGDSTQTDLGGGGVRYRFFTKGCVLTCLLSFQTFMGEIYFKSSETPVKTDNLTNQSTRQVTTLSRLFELD